MAAAPWSDGIYIQYTKADGTKTSQVFIECGEPIGYPNTTEKLGDYLDRVAQGWDIQFGEVANKIKCQKGINWYDVDTESLSYTYEGGVVLDIYMKIPSNPTISQLHIDGVTYDLRDRNAGEGVTPEEKAKLAALPEAAEIPSDIGPKSEVVEEVPSEYVAGKVYFLKDKEWAPKDKSALIALGSNDIVIAELNSHPTEYFEFFNNGTPEGLILYPITGGDGIFVKGTDIKRIAINEGSYNQYAYKNGVWEKIHNGEPA